MSVLQHWITRNISSSFDRGGFWLVSLGVLTTLIYVFSKLWWTDNSFSDLPGGLMIITFLISAWRSRKDLRGDWVFRLFALSVVIPLLLFAVNYLLDAEAAVKYQVLDRLIRFFFFLPLAWWIGANRVTGDRILLLAALGLLLAVLLDPNLSDSLKTLWQGERIDFNLRNAQHTALFFGLMLIGCTAYLMEQKPSKPPGNRLLLLCLLVPVALVGFWGAQTRAAFLAMLICGLVAIFGYLVKHWRIYNGKRKTRLAVIFVVAVALLWVPASKVMQQRFSAEQSTLNSLMAGDLDSVPFTSMGIRIHSWAESIHWIEAKPLTGWGLSARGDVIRLAEDFPPEVKQKYSHLHNSYLELLLAYGLVGLIFFIALLVIVYRRIVDFAATPAGKFARYGLLYLLVMSFFESYLMMWTGIFALALILGPAYSLYLGRSLGSPLQTDQ